MIIVNASPFILLGKIGKLDLFKSLFHHIIIPRQVFDELMAKPKNREALFQQHAIQEGWIQIEDIVLNKNLISFTTIHKAELYAISLAMKRRSMLIMDDDTAKFIAQFFHVEVHGTLFVILSAYKKKIIKNKKELIAILDDLMDNGLYLSREVYLDFLKLAEGFP